MSFVTPRTLFIHYVHSVSFHSCIPAMFKPNVVTTSTKYHPISPAIRPVTFSRKVWKYVAVLSRENHQSPSTAKFILNQRLHFEVGYLCCSGRVKIRNRKVR